ncbi:unnamed protein product [Psylliodes chrysocephalus]|uniref:Proton-coupled folate transporter n=1 Tax=Psylliodes chrysocephalus TaxID=3402493 RepID=A0A9P0GDL3_9CUCU|nr:unnamed protein product [Psylliodes chrysocephala]
MEGNQCWLLYYYVCLLFLCMTLGFSIGAIILSFKEINPWWIMSSTIPSVLCGGIMTFFIIVLSYLNDTATPENRAWRMVSIDAIQIGTTLAGGISSSFILYATSYSSIYGTCALLVATGCAYAYFFCPESLKRKSEEKPTIKSLFQWNNITDLFKVAWRKREYGKRTLIFLLMSSQIIVHFVVYGEVTVKTLYLRNRFNWTMQEKNIFSAYSSVLIVICTIACTYLLHKKFKIREGVLVIMSLTSTIASTLLFALSNTDNFLYISAVAGMFSGLAIPMTRTMMAKLIVPEEMGKLFSLVMVINTIGMLVSSVMYQQIYNTTMKNHPEIFNYISFGLYASVVVIVIFVMIFESRIPGEDIDEKNKNVINSE